MVKKFILILVFGLAFILRFYLLGANPPSLDWDEASLGYNAYSILETGKDEYGTYLPLSIRSFNDHKPPLYTYLTIPAVYLFDPTEFSTRLVSAIAGFAAVIGVYFLINELTKGKNKKLSLIAAFLFAISPWHIQFSRIAFEANLALTMFIYGTYFFLTGLNKRFMILVSMLFYALSMYAYHSERLVVPIFITGLVVIFRQYIWKNKKYFALSLLLFVILIIPIIKNQLDTSSRFGSVTVISPSERLDESIKLLAGDIEKGDFLGKWMHNRRLIFARDILGGYLDHFNFDFLFLTGDPPGRHHAVGMGMLYLA
ncbi:MAG: glycosyltransferase family 39 protein, partial [Nitrososphaeraceae archaeon]|nr:glycosyltransferase family 39 protein [Nitrososphaeraceae archaeon]